MEFLEKLFEYEHFSAILFTVIGVLTVLFVLVLVQGKKDAKKAKLEKEKTDEMVDTIKITPVGIEEPVQTVDVPVQEPDIKVAEEIMASETFAESNDPFANDPIVIEPLSSENGINNNGFDVHNDIFSTGPVVTESIAEPTVVEEVVMPTFEPVVQPNLNPVFEQVIEPITEIPVEPEVVEEPKSAALDFEAFAASLGPVAQNLVQSAKEDVLVTNSVVEPTEVYPKEEPIRRSIPEQFSSVFVDKTATPFQPVANNEIEMPGLVDMPKAVEEAKSEPVLPNLEHTMAFPGIEPEIYDIKNDN